MAELYPIRYDETDNYIEIIDQTVLPNQLEYKRLTSLSDVWNAIKKLEVRGAPLIGVTAAYGLTMFALSLKITDWIYFRGQVISAKQYLENVRPTAVNLKNILNRMQATLEAAGHQYSNIEDIKIALLNEAKLIHQEDCNISENIGKFGAAILNNDDVVLTICNAGLLATSNNYGTALAPVYKAVEDDKNISVIACETRPILQGARLTAFELEYKGIQTSVITDNMIGWLMTTRQIDAIFVGCDRVAQNGDFANKIGTYTLAVLAEKHKIPFYVCMPSTSIDFDSSDSAGFEIEMRDPNEVRKLWYEKPMIPQDVDILNPAFDITSASYVSGYISEKGIVLPPFSKEMFL